MNRLIKLKEIGPDLIKKLDDIDLFSKSGSNYTVVGFTRIGIQDEVTENIHLGGMGIPTVVIIDNDTGIIHQIAFYKLFPELNNEQV